MVFQVSPRIVEINQLVCACMRECMRECVHTCVYLLSKSRNWIYKNCKYSILYMHTQIIMYTQYAISDSCTCMAPMSHYVTHTHKSDSWLVAHSHRGTLTYAYSHSHTPTKCTHTQIHINSCISPTTLPVCL